MNCIGVDILVGFFIGLAVSFVVTITSIIGIGLILKNALLELKTKMNTNIDLQNIFETKYFSKDMM